MTKSTGVGRGGKRPGAGLKPGTKKTKLKSVGEVIAFSLSYSREDTARLRKAWRYSTQSDKTPLDFKDWLKEIAKRGPLEHAERINGLYDEDEDLPIVE